MSGTDKVALVTGGASGIGRAAVLELASSGVQVAIADIDVPGGTAVADEVKSSGGRSFFVEADVARPEGASRMVDATVEQFGRLDWALNNAGVEGVLAPVETCSEEDWDHVMGINLKGVWLSMKYEIRAMQDSGGGSIVNVSSVMGRVANAQSPAYAASKHGVVGLTLSAALAHAERGIRVNAVCPGWTRTPMIERLLGQEPEREENAIALHPIGRLGLPEEIARAAMWLLSDDSSFVTGTILPVDGGYLAR